MRITEGQIWKSSNNKIFRILRDNLGMPFPIMAIDDKKKIHSFTSDGKVLEGNYPHENDLKERV